MLSSGTQPTMLINRSIHLEPFEASPPLILPPKCWGLDSNFEEQISINKIFNQYLNNQLVRVDLVEFNTFEILRSTLRKSKPKH